MSIVLDASSALAWLFGRQHPAEAVLSQQTARSVDSQGAIVAALWFPEVTNGLLVAERNRAVTQSQISGFQADLAALPIEMDSAPPESVQASVLALARQTGLSAYDATHLELAIRSKAQLATFDRKLAEAARFVGVIVFGDPA